MPDKSVQAEKAQHACKEYDENTQAEQRLKPICRIQKGKIPTVNSLEKHGLTLDEVNEIRKNIRTHVYVCMYMYVCMHVCTYIRAYMYICMHVCMCKLHMIYMVWCVYVCMYACMYACTCVLYIHA